ncbi:MAG TPA: cardiolipin synthase, partial [Thermoanaerobaculia bacterium]
MRKNWDWHVPVIGALGLLLWSTNRRRSNPKFDLAGEVDLDGMIPTLVGITEGAVDEGNRVEILQNGAFFDRLLQDVAQAKKSIHIESYIWWSGAICDRVAQALAKRACDGIEVRLLLDYSGSSRMDRRLLDDMKRAKCDVRQFHPPRISNIARMNNRTHRKIGIFDGRIAYVGGHGIADQWTGKAEDRDHWRDTAVRCEGPVVTTLQGVFCENWIEETGEVPAGEAYFPKIERRGDTDAHVAYASPHGSISTVQLLYYLGISAARRELIIQNPYFLPHPDAIGALKAAVRRGVDVQVMLPAAKVIDSPLVQHASHHHFGDLLEAGVRIFEYQKTLMHQKVMIIDGSWSCVGSTNFDDRSFELNDEITIGFTDPEIARQLRDAYKEDLRDAEELEFDAWRTRPWRHRLLDGGAFLMRG